MPASPDVVVLGTDWKFRAPLRAQLIEEGFDVVATDTCLRPGSLSLDMTLATLAYVAIKPIHFRASAALCWLAILAVGAHRVPLAVGLTLLACFGIELAEATVVGHIARLADMVSYLIGAVGAAVVFVGGYEITSRLRKPRIAAQIEPTRN